MYRAFSMLQHNLHLCQFSTNLQMDFYAGEKFQTYSSRALTHILWKCYGLEHRLTKFKTVPTNLVQSSNKQFSSNACGSNSKNIHTHTPPPQIRILLNLLDKQLSKISGGGR